MLNPTTIKEYAYSLGFDTARITSAEALPEAERVIRERIAEGLTKIEVLQRGRHGGARRSVLLSRCTPTRSAVHYYARNVLSYRTTRRNPG